jgi:hypothetical protein
MRGMTKTSEEKWRALIAPQEKSGLGVREFAESRGLVPATMYWWRCRLRERPTSLVPLAVIERDVEIRRSTTSAAFELTFDSLTVRIPPGFDEGDLRRLVRALRC